jgi:mRNA-degrading endonuclease RelE of RelBE toxin-antitoxin system
VALQIFTDNAVRQVTYSVHLGVNLEGLPEDVRLEVGRTMQQIADAVTTIPPSSAFWSSMKDSLLQIDVRGYRVVYRIDAVRRVIIVVEVARLG